ncbi:DUF7477 domain-containing protein [Roseivirga sp.]|uniref:DUF7477 domain-containing protein n=1 Tax=Roseivirga sp. TaxID=1964215 RepID=UPI003B8DE7D3
MSKRILTRSSYLLILATLISLEGLSQSSYNDYSESQKTEYYREDFNNPSSQWESYSSGKVLGKIHEGYFDWISMNDKAHVRYTSIAYMDWDLDWQIEVRMKQVNGKTTSSNDVVWDREVGNSNKYHFGFTSAGKYNISEYNDGYQPIVDFTEAEFVNKRDFNKITVRKVRDTYYYFFNERFITRSAYKPVKDDYLGIVVPPNSTLQVDYIDVSYLDKKTNNPYLKTGYHAVMTKRNGYSIQRWKTRDIFPKEEIKTDWNEGYSISNLSYINEKWTLVTSKGTGFSNQQWKTRIEFPKAEIKELWGDGLKVTELNYGNGLWALVMSKTSNYGSQRWSTSYNFPINKIKEFREGGYYISELIYGNDRWALVGSKDARIKDQEWFRSTEFPRDKIESLTNQGFTIGQLEYHYDSWVLVMNRVTDEVSNIWFSDANFPKEKIRTYWDQGYYLTDITYLEESTQVIQTKELLADILVGTWYGGGAAGEPEQGELIFGRDRMVTMIAEGDTLGGANYYQENIKIDLKYEVIETSSPKGFDLIFSSSGTDYGRIKGIIRMIDDDEFEMKLANDMTDARPTEMRNESDIKIAIFKRVK